ncbi:hypothetical protein CLU96_4552 [Chryseobacterium sp. 52]|uniref:hypothetical protein n=1 Tax=Chryseobacterium sp. 52 TaxID=2035213 RepID=UPI000C5CBA35|nr:hypothetical protein [Chryseobacterium sp. 52]PIF47494.1 hypothetical protein CLU96_4552 [Chryseobacterium sp. 52]
MKTKFTLKALLPLPLSIGFFYLIIVFLPSIFTDPYYENKLFPRIFFPCILTFSFIVVFLGEVRTKCIILEIRQNEIIIKRFLGLQTKSYKLSEIEGWKYSHLTSKGGTYEYLYLYKNGNKVAKMSQFYHRNYFQVKNHIQAKFKYLGYEKLSYIDELKEMFK